MDRKAGSGVGKPSFPTGKKRWPLHWMVVPLFCVACLIFLRRGDVFVHPQFWAEDALILFLGARLHGWHTLFTPHPAYLVVAQRLVACSTTHLPALYVPLAYCYAAFGYMLLTAWFCLRARLDYLMDRRGRIAFALAIILAPQSGEVLMALINSQWTLMPILPLLIIQDQPSRPRQAVADFLGLLLAGMTGPFSALFAPWFLVRLRKVTGGWSRYNLLLIGTAWALAIAQILTMRTGPLPHEPWSLDPHAWSKELGFYFPGGLFFGAVAPNYLGKAFYVISPLLLALLGWALWRGERKRLWTVLALLGCGGLVYAGGVRSSSSDFLNGLLPFGPGARYFYAFYVFAMWTGVIYYHDVSPRLRAASRIALGMMLLASASQFTTPLNPNLHWDNYTRPLDAGEAEAGIPVLPDWTLDVPAKE